jgi:hypothetical protein
MLGVINVGPVPKEVPPVNALYQLIVPALAVAARVTVPVPHREAGVVPVIVGKALTATICVAITGPLHPAAFAVMVVVPVQVGKYVTAPVAGTIVFPPDKLATSRLYVIPVVFVAVAV